MGKRDTACVVLIAVISLLVCTPAIAECPDIGESLLTPEKVIELCEVTAGLECCCYDNEILGWSNGPATWTLDLVCCGSGLLFAGFDVCHDEHFTATLCAIPAVHDERRNNLEDGIPVFQDYYASLDLSISRCADLHGVWINEDVCEDLLISFGPVISDYECKDCLIIIPE